MRWLLLLVAVLVAALILQAGLLAFAVYVLLGVLLLSQLLSRNWVEAVVATRLTLTLAGSKKKPAAEIQGPVQVGDIVEVAVELRNQGSIGIAWVLIEDLLPTSAIRQRNPRLALKGKRLKMARLGRGKTLTLRYKIECLMRGYYQLGPTLLETGDLFGLHRRHRVVTLPGFLMVHPRVVPLPRYDFVSQRPIGEVTLAHRLFEDPTRNGGIRPYQIGDPLQRIHWRSTARTGTLQSRIYEPTSLAGATILLDFNEASYHTRGEPFRSELAITVAASLAYAVSVLNQQVGLVSNGRDAADRIRLDVKVQAGDVPSYATREQARESGEVYASSERLRPVIVETRRSVEQFSRILDSLARLELTDGLSFARLVIESTPRLPRDATVIAILADVSIETSVCIGNLRRQGFAVTAVLIGMEDDDRSMAAGRLMAEGVRDVRHVNSEEELANLGRQMPQGGSVPYTVATPLA